MGREVLSRAAFARVEKSAKIAGSATHAGEQRRREGLGLHPLVDPAGYSVIRRSKSWYEPEGDYFKLLRGVAMLEETRLDTTGSMGRNVEVAMRVLPKTYDLLATGADAVLGRYDVQMITSIFGDVTDQYVLCRSQAEMDVRIAEQMTLMVPESDGGDATEDPQYGLFGAAYLTWSQVNEYGLKYYDFTISDADARDHVDEKTLIRVFGGEVFDKIKENGLMVDRKNLPTTTETVTELQNRAHAFFLQVGNDHRVGGYWRGIYGDKYVVPIPTVEYLPQVKAAIIGLTEGTLNLQTVGSFLERHLNKTEAAKIVRAVSCIPIGAQAALPNFNKIPLRGAVFAKKGDLWPIDSDNTAASAKIGAKNRINWLGKP